VGEAEEAAVDEDDASGRDGWEESIMWPFSAKSQQSPDAMRTLRYHWHDGTTTTIEQVTSLVVWDGKEAVDTSDGRHIFIPSYRMREDLP